MYVPIHGQRDMGGNLTNIKVHDATQIFEIKTKTFIYGRSWITSGALKWKIVKDIVLKNFIQEDRTYDFLDSLNPKFNQEFKY